MKRGRLAGQWSPRAVALYAEVKRVFDPKGLLNPGMKVATTEGGIGPLRGELAG